ncbi:MAG: FtsX-like permease family protein [Saprospiraceae bacterium]|nr:ABC transporter permease [Lewinella sp.]
MWNQKRKNLGLLLEVFFSFLVIFAVFTFLVHNFNRYREPLGFDYGRVWALKMFPSGERDSTYEAHTERVNREIDRIDQIVRYYPEFESYTFTSGNIPYAGSQHLVGMSYNDKSTNPFIYSVDEKFPEVMGVEMVAGRWLDRSDMSYDGDIPIVINRQFREYFFDAQEEVIGKKLDDPNSDQTYRIIGEIGNYKQLGEFSEARVAFFQPRTNDAATALLVKVKPDTDAAVEARLFDDIQEVAKNWNLEMQYMDEMRDNTLRETWIPSLIFLIIAGFLVFNVALGLFGVVWQNINKRRQEIGVRRAMGATKTGISGQIIGEVIVLATLSLLLGLFFALQFPLLNVFNLPAGVYLVAIVLAIMFIYAIVLICSFYPSLLAARLHPAVALHEE